MKTWTRFTALLLALVLACSLLPVGVEASSFSDVKDDAWYAEAVETAFAQGWMLGVGENRFRPNAAVTRAMFVTVLARFAGVETDENAAAFDDVAAGKWYSGPVAWAAENGIVYGVGNGCFAPNKTISRQDLCTIITRFVQAREYHLSQDHSRTFNDESEIASYARDAVFFCAAAGLVAGDNHGSFNPRASATRAQAAVILTRLQKLLNGEEVNPEPMPARSFDPVESEGVTVSVNAPAGALPADTQLTVSRVTDETDLDAMAAQLDGSLIAAVDVSFSKNGAPLQPRTEVEVQISLEELENLQNPAVYHRNADGALEPVPARLIPGEGSSGAKSLRFWAKDFSVYAVADSGDVDLYARLKLQFMTPKYPNSDQSADPEAYELEALEENAFYVTRRHVINTDAPDGQPINYLTGLLPDISVSEPDGGLRFLGWSFREDPTPEEAGAGQTIQWVREQIKAKLELPGGEFPIVDGVTTIQMYPILFHPFKVTYLDELGETVLDTRMYFSKQSTTKIDVDLDYQPADGFALAGWERSDDDSLVEPGVKDLAIQGDLTLRAKLKAGFYLTFNTNPGTKNRYRGAPQLPPVFCEDGVVPENAKPQDPVLPGYTFGGWYPESQFAEGEGDAAEDTWNGNPYPFTDTEIRYNVNLAARWIPAETDYAVVIWTQKVTDPADDDPTNNTYEYFDTWYGKAVTGAVQTVPTELTQLGGSQGSQLGLYFTYNAEKSDQDPRQIYDDGSTTFQVYYDREIITYRGFEKYGIGFTCSRLQDPDVQGADKPYLPETGASISNSLYNIHIQHFGLVDGVYVPLTLQAAEGYAPDSLGDIPCERCVWTTPSGQTYPVTHRSTGSGLETAYYPANNIFIPVKPGPNDFEGDALVEKKGLYGAPVEGWPQAPEGLRWYRYDSDGTGNVFAEPVETFDPAETLKETTVNLWLRWHKQSDETREVRFFYMDPDGTYPDAPAAEDIRSCQPGERVILQKQSSGFELEKLGPNGESREDPGALVPVFNDAGKLELYYTDESAALSGNQYSIGENGANVYYARRRYKLRFVVNNQEDASYEVYCGAGLYGYKDRRPSGEDEGHSFGQWYADPDCTVPFDFDGTMPDHSLAAYTKMHLRQYRVFLHTGIAGLEENNMEWPVDANGNPLISFADPHQPKNFLADFGSVISGGRMLTALRTDEKGNPCAVVGWYLDQGLTKPFDFRTLLTDEIADADDYRKNGDNVDVTDWQSHVENETDEAGNPVLDENGNPRTVEVYDRDTDGNRIPVNSDVNRPWVGKKINLYPKWQTRPKGAAGINILYDAVEGSGKFPEASQEPAYLDLDPLCYAVGANAIARSAPEPLSPDKEFLYWEVMKPEGEGGTTLVPTGARCFPGQPFPVKMEWVAASDHTAAGQSNSAGPSEANAASTARPVSGTAGNTVGAAGNMTKATGNASANAFGAAERAAVGIAEPGAAAAAEPGRAEISAAPTHTQSAADTPVPDAGENEEYIPATTVEPGVDYLIGYKVSDTKVVLLTNSESYNVYGASATSAQRYGYGVPAVMNGENVIGVTGTIGSDTEATLTDVKWRFVSSESGYLIQSQKNNSKYLRIGQDYILPEIDYKDLYAEDDGTIFTWDPQKRNLKGSVKFVTYEQKKNGYYSFGAESKAISRSKLQLYKRNSAHTVTFVYVDENGMEQEIKKLTVQAGSLIPENEIPEAPVRNGWTFTGWDVNPRTVTVTEDLKITALYQKEQDVLVTFVNWDGSVYEQRQVSKGSDVPVPAEDPVRQGGYRFVGWDGVENLTKVQEDTYVYAIFRIDVTRTCTMTLRAVYGEVHQLQSTHITWYANNGTGAWKDSETVPINDSIGIAPPETFENEGYTFLGWARMPERTEAADPNRDFTVAEDDSTRILAYKDLSPDDLWLVYHPAVTGQEAYFSVREENPETHQIEALQDGAAFTCIAADQRKPDQGLYAVWARTPFFVVHSSDGTMEAVSMPDPIASDDGNQDTQTPGRIDLTRMVKPGYLYGGYYTDYGGALSSEIDDMTASCFLPADSAAAIWASVEVDDGDPYQIGVGIVRKTDLVDSAAKFQQYTGAFSYYDFTGETPVGSNFPKFQMEDGKPVIDPVTLQPILLNSKIWTAANGGDRNGKTDFTPVAGEVYYLKEVPEAYLTSKVVYVRDEHNGNVVNQLYQVTLIDDNVYDVAGFRSAAGTAYGSLFQDNVLERAEQLSRSFTLHSTGQGEGGAADGDLTVDPSTFNLEGGLVAVKEISDLLTSNPGAFDQIMLPAWRTCDGVEVFRDPMVIHVNEDHTEVTAIRDFSDVHGESRCARLPPK